MNQEEKDILIKSLYKNLPLSEFKKDIMNIINNAKTKEELGMSLLAAFNISQMDNVIKYK